MVIDFKFNGISVKVRAKVPRKVKKRLQQIPKYAAVAFLITNPKCEDSTAFVVDGEADDLEGLFISEWYSRLKAFRGQWIELMCLNEDFECLRRMRKAANAFGR